MNNDLPLTSRGRTDKRKQKTDPERIERDKEIKRLYFETGFTQSKIGKKFNLSQSGINRILSGKNN